MRDAALGSRAANLVGENTDNVVYDELTMSLEDLHSNVPKMI